MAASTITIYLLCLVSMATPVVRATSFLVGDAHGWTGTPTGYVAEWASRYPFAVGDELVFGYDPEQHAVQVVSEIDYNNCNTENPISSHGSGRTTITLDKTGYMYFICPKPGHCEAGMKMAVKVGCGTNCSSGTGTGMGSGNSTGDSGMIYTGPTGAAPNLDSGLVLGFSMVIAMLIACYH